MTSIIDEPSHSDVAALSKLSFGQPDLLSALCTASSDEFDQADFGIVAMGLDSVVTYYNRWESQLSGLVLGNVVGRHFFSEVAPCTNNFMVSLKYEALELDEIVDYVFSYRLRPVSVRLRLLKSVHKGKQFMVVERASKQ